MSDSSATPLGTTHPGTTHLVVSCAGGERTVLERRPIPEPGPGELLLRLRVVGLCGTDLFKLAHGKAAVGDVLGHELVGEVTAVGSGVAGFSAGDRVVVPHHVACGECLLCRRGSETMCDVFRENLLEPGAFAEHVGVRSRAVELAARVLPDGLADEAAVFLEPAACVLRGVDRSGVTPGAHVAILGAGSMGLLHLLVLRAALDSAIHSAIHSTIHSTIHNAIDGKIDITVIDPVPERRAAALELGADRALAPGDDARDTVLQTTDGHGVDAVFDTVGGAAILASALELTRRGGSVVLFAHAPEGESAGFELNDLFKHERRVIGTYSGGLAEQKRVFELLKDGSLDPRPLVTHRLPLGRFDEGVRLVRERRAMKVLYTGDLDTRHSR